MNRVAVTTERWPVSNELSPLEIHRVLSERFGAEQVFLLESPAGPATDCRSAVVGFGAVLTISVKDSVVEISGEPELVEAATAATAPVVRRDELTDPRRLWELLRLAQDAFQPADSSTGFGFLAFFGYDTVRYVEDLPRLIDNQQDLPDVCVVVHRGRVRIDLADRAAELLVHRSTGWPDLDAAGVLALLNNVKVANPPAATTPAAPPAESYTDDTDEATFHRNVRRCLRHIAIGDIYQVQIGHELRVRSQAQPVEVYQRLRERNPSPYMYLAQFAGHTIIGASPELFVRLEDGVATMRPIAGTLPIQRGSGATDAAAARFRTDPKEVAEHVMLVDLCRNDIGRVCDRDTLAVDDMLAVDHYSHVAHLVSTVVGRVTDVDSYEVIRALFPSGTMTGAPKIRAMEIIESIETSRRGLYAGALGLIDFDGTLNLALCIRSLFHSGHEYVMRASAGVVADSRPDREWRETLAKMSAAYWAVTGKELVP